MTDVFQYRQVIELEYLLGKGQINIKMENTNDIYYSKIDEVKINPKITFLKKFMIFKDSVRLNFSKPIICNIQSGRNFSSMFCGVDFEGKDKNILVERLDGLKDRLSSINEGYTK